MDDNNKPKTPFTFPNSDRPLDSKEETRGPVNPNPEHETVKFKDVMENKESQFIQNDSGIPQIETYNSDVAQAIKKNSVSAMQIALAEQKKQQDRQFAGAIVTEEKSHSLLIKVIFGALFLVIVMLGYLWWAGYLTSKGTAVQNQANNQPTQQTAAPIKIEQRQLIPIDGKDSISIKNIIGTAKNGNIDAATVKEIVLGTMSTNGSVNLISTSDWFKKLDTHAPDQLVRALGDNYIMGVYGSTPRETFMIFTVKSYDNAFAGMLNWESYLNEDMGDIFDRGIAQTATSSIVNQRVFTDKILFNKDTRILNGNDGQTKMLYTFIDPKTLIIVSSETGLRELISRLTTGKITR